LVAEVAYLGFTDDGILRHPTFQGLRDDKVPTEVHREEEAPREQTSTATPEIRSDKEPAPSASARVSSVDTTSIKLSNPDKLLYPDVGITKRQLLDYLALVAPRMLPHVRNRPLTLVRCPNGQNRPCFFQKHTKMEREGLRSVAIREKEGKADYAVIDDATGLFSLVQLGVLEIHTCGSQANDYEHPDILVFDLDPDPSVDFSEVVRCARRLRELFSAANLESFVKTTGGKGLHVCVPIDPRLSWSQAKAFTKNLANALVAESPQRYVATQSKELRRGKIFIDYLRNGRGATFVAPYSMRAHPAATVATPLFWEELTPSLKPEQFTVLTIPERISRLESDPFQHMATLQQKLPGI
jgi:bifunctional non-homologous end joining protein LigD